MTLTTETAALLAARDEAVALADVLRRSNETLRAERDALKTLNVELAGALRDMEKLAFFPDEFSDADFQRIRAAARAALAKVPS